MDPTQSDVGQSESSGSTHSPVMLPPCRICNEKASGFHYGVNTCEACKGFFRRSLKKTIKYTCAYDSRCSTQYCKRNMCAACRYNKCVEAGMSKRAISKGRYTHEKKTNNIIEVKRLEQRTAAEPPGGVVALLPKLPPGDVVALLPKLPLRITEYKYEEIIAHILAAYQEQSAYTMNFFTNMKVWEDVFLEKRRLYEDTFGSLKPVTAEEYLTIYQSTGLDIDGRREFIEYIMPSVEIGLKQCIAFIKAIPGFTDLPMEDQVALFKLSRHEMFAIMVHKNFNLKRRLVTFFWGETMDFERFSTLHSAELVEAVFSMSSHIQKLELCKTEMIILSCIPLFFTDRCKLECPEKVKDIQQLLVETFSYLLEKKHPDDPIRLAQCFLLFPELRSLSRLYNKEEENFAVMWNDKIELPPFLFELWSA